METQSNYKYKWMQKLFKPATIESLEKTKKSLFMMQIAFSVMTVISLATKGLSDAITVAAFALTIFIIMTYNKCEVEIMKIELETEIEQLIVANKES